MKKVIVGVVATGALVAIAMFLLRRSSSTSDISIDAGLIA